MGTVFTITLLAVYLLVGVTVIACAWDQIVRDCRSDGAGPGVAIVSIAVVAVIGCPLWPFFTKISFTGGDDEI